MWIQVRTMDGKVAHTVNSLSRLTKVENLRRRIQEVFHVEPGLQRLFYRGKQVNPPCRLPACPPRTFVLASSMHRTHTLPPSSGLLRHRNLHSLSKEQRLDSQTDTPGGQLALESVAFGGF